MTDEMKAAKTAELLALGEEMTEKEKEIYASYGLVWPFVSNGSQGFNDWKPPEVKELNREMALKIKAIQDKYKD